MHWTPAGGAGIGYSSHLKGLCTPPYKESLLWQREDSRGGLPAPTCNKYYRLHGGEFEKYAPFREMYIAEKNCGLADGRRCGVIRSGLVIRPQENWSGTWG